MSNNRNNDEAMGFAIVMTVIGIICIAIIAAYYLAALAITFVLTCLCIGAWFEPYTSDKATIFPEEARAFIVRGLLFCGIAMIVTAWGVEHKDWEVSRSGWWLIGLTAYMAGSLGIQVLLSPELADGTPDIFPKREIPALPAPSPITIEATAIEVPTAPPEPFEFGEWDDAELRS